MWNCRFSQSTSTKIKKNVPKTELLTLTLAVNWLTRVDNVVYGNTRHKTDNVTTG